MKALVKARAEPGIWMQDVPEPSVGHNDVLIKVHRSAICGTDMHIYNWDAWAQKTVPVPMAVGHEYSGEIVDMGKAHHVKLSSVNGHIELAMPKAANAHLTANTVSGSISSDFSLPIHKGWVGSNLDTTLGSGATQVELSNVNGSIKIHGGNAGI